MSLLLVLRPEPGASATAARAAALGHGCVVAPLFATHPIDWVPPDPRGYDAVMMTSANAARLGGSALARFTGLPVYAVGGATAAAARAAGFARVSTGQGDVGVLLDRVASDGVGRLLHFAGREHRPDQHAGVAIERCIVYASEPVDILPAAAGEALAAGAVALLHSPRAAALFATLAPADVRIACLSPAVAAAAGGEWRAVAIAAAPTNDALLAAAAGVCDHPMR